MPDHIMITDSYDIFCHQLDFVIKKFPNFKIAESVGGKMLKGILDIINLDNEVVSSFSVEIRSSPGFPFRFPFLFEVGGDIPNEADWHKYPDGRCCITVDPDEILKCKNGVSILEFMENYGLPYLANQAFRKAKGMYKNGEYSHGRKGVLEFYADFFKTSDISKWKEYIHVLKLGKEVKTGRNERCFCGSGLKYKNCHAKIFYNANRLGIEQIFKDLKEYI